MFIVGIVMISLGPLLDAILKDLHVSRADGGLFAVAIALGNILGVFSLNVVLARIPIKWSLVGAVWIQTAGLFASALLAHGLWSLFGTLFVVGFGVVFLNAIPGMLIGHHVRQGTARVMVVVLLFFAIGMMVTPPLIGVALDLGASWHSVLIVEGIVSAGLAIALTALPVLDIPGRENLRFRHVREVAAFNPRLLTVVLAAAFTYIGSEFILNVWLSKFEIDTLGASRTWAGLVVTMFWIGLVGARLGLVPFTRRVLASRLLVGCMAVMAVFSLGLAIAPSKEISLAVSFLAGVGASAAFPLICSYSGKFPHWHSGVVFSGIIFVSGFGRLIFPYVIGPLAAATTFRVALGLAAVLAAVTVVLGLVLHKVGDRDGTREVGSEEEAIALRPRGVAESDVAGA
jgi:fucose permease